MKCSTKIIFLAINVIVFSNQASAQPYSLPSDGKDFYLGFVNPSYNTVASPEVEAFYGAYALVSSYTDNHITVSYFDKITGVETFSQRYFIPERTGIQVPLDLSKMTPNKNGDLSEFCSCHITADRPINIEFFSSGACGGGSYLPIQTAALGRKYVIASYANNPGTLGIMCDSAGPSSIEDSHGFFEIISPNDNTNVTIIPNSTTMGGHIGYSTGAGAIHIERPYTINLRRGQCYFVKSASNDNTDDISNSIVTSDKPIAVIAGHENAAIGGISKLILEGRDYMVEQMYPYEVWDTTGYVMIPLKDSQPADASTYDGVGENYRMFTSESPGAQINFYDGGVGQPLTISAGKLQSPPTERDGVTNPIDVEGTNRVPFTVMMYDQRNVATTAPYPAPSMLTVIPMSKWRTSYLWYVPANKFETLQGYYLNVIAPDADFTGLTGIQASFNGGPIKPIKNVLSIDQQFKIIKNFPGLTGIRFKLYPGSYYARGPHPFMIYNYGMRGLDPEMDLGDMDCEDYFFSYACPTGFQIGSGSPHFKVTIDTGCSFWNVCVHDSTFGLSNQGIKFVTLLDDAFQDFVKATPSKAYYNTRFDDSLDPGNTRDIDLIGNDSDFCFKVLVNKPIDSAYAPVFIADDQGNAIVLDLYYHPPLAKLTPDTGRFLLTGLHNDSCQRYIFYNKGSAGGRSYLFTSANLKIHNPNFSVTNITPPLPVSLKPGDSISITACFNPKDTILQQDTIELVNDCFTEPIDLTGSGSTPLIVADNHDFGDVVVDSTACGQVTVKNIGTAPLLLTKGWVMDNYGKSFSFPDTLLLPVLLKPQQKLTFTFCYTPHSHVFDSTVFHWGTNLIDPYSHQIKDTSILIGRSVMSGFYWDRNLQTMFADSLMQNDSVISRVNLYNSAAKFLKGPIAHIDQVTISGPDASEFYILDNKLGYNPLRNFDLNPGDSIWVDVVFKPDLTKPYPQRFADRHANLVASGPGEADQIVNLTGTWVVNGVAVSSPPQQLFTIRPNPASGNSVIVTFASLLERNTIIALYDILGREVYHAEILAGMSAIEIPIGNLSSGIYYLRLNSSNAVNSEKLDIIKN